MEQLTFAGTLDSLAAIAEQVKREAARAGLAKRAAYGLRLAVDELATNIVVHGYGNAGHTGPIWLATELGPEWLTVVLEDEAPAFDPRSIAPPDDLAAPAEERAIGGLGVFLVLEEVDQFDYERAAGRNRSTLRMRRPAPELIAHDTGNANDHRSTH